jgi:hypothetical protein
MPSEHIVAMSREEIAQALQMNYVFGWEFEELAQRHNGMPAYHGQATLSRFPLLNSRILRFHCQSRFWLPRWFIPRMKPFPEAIRRQNGTDQPHRSLMDGSLLFTTSTSKAGEMRACDAVN